MQQTDGYIWLKLCLIKARIGFRSSHTTKIVFTCVAARPYFTHSTYSSATTHMQTHTPLKQRLTCQLAQDRLVAVCNGSSKLLASNGSVAQKLQIPSTAANGCSTCNCDRLGIPSSAPPIVVMHVAACRYPIVRNFRLDQRGQFPVRLIFDLAIVRLRRAINQMWRVFKTNQPYS